MHRNRPRARSVTALAVAGLLPALAAVIGGAVSVTRCVSVPDGLMQVGVHLALLRPAQECPATGVALGGESQQVLAVAVMLTLPMLLLHAGVLLGSWGTVAALRRSLTRLAGLTPWRRVPTARTLPLPTRAHAVVVAARAPAQADPLLVPLLRGPPAAVPA